MTIDSHQHFWRYNAARDTWITDEMAVLKRDFLPEELEREMDANGVDLSIAVQAEQSEGETDFLLGLADASERIAGVVGWLDLSSPKIEKQLQHYSRAKKLRGLRHVAQSEPDDRFLVWPDFLRGIALLREFHLTYDILIYPRQLPAAIELVSRFPEQLFVLDHLAKPEIKASRFEPWAAQIKTLAQSSNVYCKVSGFVTEADWKRWKDDDFARYLNVAFEAFGPERLMFGSDWPVCLVAASYKQVKQIVESYVEAHASRYKEIFCDNAARFYGVNGKSHGLAA